MTRTRAERPVFPDWLREKRLTPEEAVRVTLEPLFALAAKGRLSIHVPPRDGVIRRESHMHFHLHPEYFFQISGACDFQFAQSRLRLEAPAVLLVPDGMAHGEIAVTPRETFCNLVLMPHSSRIGAHFAHASREGRPCLCLHCPNLEEVPFSFINELSATLARTAGLDTSRAHRLRQGIILTLIGRILEAVESRSAPKAELSKVAQCRQLVRTHLVSRELNVNQLAEWLHCAPSYLSHVFRKETGMTLTAHIGQKRIEYAEHLLSTTAYSVSQIAWACGFASPAYFSRLFRKLRGNTPRAHRRTGFVGEPT